MSYAAFNLLKAPTAVDNCACAYLTHCSTFDSSSDYWNSPEVSNIYHSKKETRKGLDGKSIEVNAGIDKVSEFSSNNLPNLVLTRGNVLEVYSLQNYSSNENEPSNVKLDLLCHYRLFGTVESLCILSPPNRIVNHSFIRDSILLTFRDAKVSVLQFDLSTHELKTSSLHFFEGHDWVHLKKGREKFPSPPLAYSDPLGRCAAVLLYNCQLILFKTNQLENGVNGEESLNPNPTSLPSLSPSPPKPSSPSARVESSYVVDISTNNLHRNRDFVFLHAYNEPVVAVLTENQPSWSGSSPLNRFTCSVTALLLNLQTKAHPVLWTAANLPYDTHRLLAVPEPIGGMIAFSPNSLHYRNQTSSYDLGLNEYAQSSAVDSSTLIQRTTMRLELDSAHATWLGSEIALISTKTGQLLLLNLSFDGRSVEKMDISLAKSSILTSCMCTLGSSFFFLGSKLADSLLVEYSVINSSKNDSQAETETDSINYPSTKRQKTILSDSTDDIGATAEEISLYNTSKSITQTSKEKAFSFSVNDSLINLSPIRDMISLPMQMHKGYNRLIACTGHGKNGSLSILQRSISPDVITEVELFGCEAIWTVYHQSDESQIKSNSKNDDLFHAYLIISMPDSTMILETGEMLGEITESVDYFTNGCTICAGNLFSRKRIVQIYEEGIRLLNGTKMTQQIKINDLENNKYNENEDSNSNLNLNNQGLTIIDAVIKDPYVLITLSDHSLWLFSANDETMTLDLTKLTLFGKNLNEITAYTLYSDKSSNSWLSQQFPTQQKSQTSVNSTIYCIICWINGDLDFFQLPELKNVFHTKQFSLGPKIVFDCPKTKTFYAKNEKVQENENEKEKNNENEDLNNVFVKEICMQNDNLKKNPPFLLASLNDGRIMHYRAFSYSSSKKKMNLDEKGIKSKGKKDEKSKSSNDNHSLNNLNQVKNERLEKLRFLRKSISMNLGESSDSERKDKIEEKDKKMEVVNAEKDEKDENVVDEEEKKKVIEKKNKIVKRRMIAFDSIGGEIHGVFLTGQYPFWFMNFRRQLRCHPLVFDSSVIAFSSLHNINCPHGFICVTENGNLRICQLSPLLNYDSEWPIQKIPLKATPHQIAHHSEANLFFLITSFTTWKSSVQILSSVNEQLQQPNENFEGDESALVEVEEFELRVMTPPSVDVADDESADTNWNLRQKIPLHFLEHALSLKLVPLKNTFTGKIQWLFAVGTSYVYGEDVACKGRLLLYEYTDDYNVGEVYNKELKGAISAIAALKGCLLVAIGRQLILYSWNGTNLDGNAFFDVPLYVVTLNTVKNYVLMGDIQKSICFLQWKEEGAQLALLGKDFSPLHVFASEFLVDATVLSLVASDANANIQIYAYAPKNMESWKGQKLLPKAEFHVGGQISKFLRMQMLTQDGSARAKYALLGCISNGAFAMLAPLDELTLKRLQALQRKLSEDYPQVAGLNPRWFRKFKSDGFSSHFPLTSDNIADFELLKQYDMLDIGEQFDLANRIGSSRKLILENIRQLDLATSFI